MRDGSVHHLLPALSSRTKPPCHFAEAIELYVMNYHINTVHIITKKSILFVISNIINRRADTTRFFAHVLNAVVYVRRHGLLENGELGIVEVLPIANQRVGHLHRGDQTRRALLAMALVLGHVIGQCHQLRMRKHTRDQSTPLIVHAQRQHN